MKHIKKLASETAIYGLSSVVGRLLNYLLVPLYTAVFLPGEFGVVTEFYAYVAFLNIIYTYGMETAYFRFASKEKDQGADYYNTSFLLVFGTSLLFSALLILFATPITQWMDYPGLERYVYWFGAILAIDAVVAIPFALLRLQGKAMKFAAIKLVNMLLNIALNLFFLVLLPKMDGFPLLVYNPALGVGYVFLANLLANGLMMVMLYKEMMLVKLRMTYAQVRPMLKYALPIMVIGLAGVTNEMLSRAMLKYLLPEGFYPERSKLDALGIFGACYKLSVFMALGIQAFRYAAEPFFFKKSAEGENKELFADVTDKFVIFGSWVFVAISVNLELLGTLFLRNPVYHEGLVIVPFLLLGSLFLGIYYNLSIWYKLTDKTAYGAVIALIGAAATVLLNVLLIPLYGYSGSAWATLATYSLITFISYVIGQKYYPVPYKVSKAVVHLAAAATLVYLHQFLPIPHTLAGAGINMLIAMGYGAVLFMIEKPKLAAH